MKPAIISYLVFLVSIMITIKLKCDAAYVIDFNGDMVKNGGSYHIGPVLWAYGGGINLSDTKNNTKVCPFYVVQDPSKVNHGDLFSFNHTFRGGFLETSTWLQINSGLPKGCCHKSTVWKISKEPPYLITTGGSSYWKNSCFHVMDYPKPKSPIIHNYMLQHCLSCFNGNPLFCYNLGLYVDDEGVRHLAFGRRTPFEFMFSKAMPKLSKAM